MCVLLIDFKMPTYTMAEMTLTDIKDNLVKDPNTQKVKKNTIQYDNIVILNKHSFYLFFVALNLVVESFL